MHEAAHGLFRRFVSRDMGILEGQARAIHILARTQPVGEDGTLAVLCRIDDGLRTIEDGRHRGRAIKHDHAVDIGLLIDDLHCRRKAVAIGIADDVHRIAMAPGRRTHFIQLFDCLGSQIGKRAVEVGERIDRHHAGATAIGDDDHTVAVDARTH